MTRLTKRTNRERPNHKWNHRICHTFRSVAPLFFPLPDAFMYHAMMGRTAFTDETEPQLPVIDNPDSFDEEVHSSSSIEPDDDNNNMPTKRERSNSRDYLVSSKGMIARITMGGMLLINTVMNSHSLHDSITRYEASMDGIQMPTRDESFDDDDRSVRRKRKLIDRQVPTSSNTSNNEIESLDQSLLSFLSESAVGRQKVIEFMIDQYVSPTSPESNLIDKLDNAMEAMSFMDTDAEPVQVVGYPFLFVGSVGTSTLTLHYMSASF